MKLSSKNVFAHSALAVSICAVGIGNPEKAQAAPILTTMSARENAGLIQNVAADGSMEGKGKILFYRNPMGLSDTSSVPKKDSMGMDYIPVFEQDSAGDGKSVKIDVEKIQKSGVRTEVVEARVIISPVRGAGTIAYDETRLTSVSIGLDAFVEKVFVGWPGKTVRVGEPLFRLSADDTQALQQEMTRRARVDTSANLSYQNALTGVNSRDWPSPVTGLVVDKRIVKGQRASAGAELFRIADTSKMWVVTDIPESEISSIHLGMRAVMTLRAYPQKPIEGTVLFFYPELKPETRTARVNIEVPNPEGRLKAGMSADVAFRVGADGAPVIAVPQSAIIDDGAQQRVFIARNDGHFEPRAVKLGMRGEGFVEVVEGVAEGETIVTSATFLIDSESNLNAALAGFRKEQPKQMQSLVGGAENRMQ